MNHVFHRLHRINNVSKQLFVLVVWRMQICFVTKSHTACVEGMGSGEARGDEATDTVEKTGDVTRVSSLDEDWVTLNQMIKYYKFGFGRVTDHVNEAVRTGLMSREEAIRLVEEYDGSCAPSYIESFCDFIDISVESFWQHVRASVNPELFEVQRDGKIERRFKVGIGL